MIKLMSAAYGKKNYVYFTEEDANTILTAMENAGMMPPNVTGTVECEPQDDGTVLLTLWKWEPEDEKV
jgi:hypothetical protein